MQTVLSKISLLHYKLPTSLNYMHIFFFNQGSSGGLPTLGIQDVLRAILVELDDWLKLVAYSSNPIHSFPRLNWQKKKEKKKEKYPARTYAFWRKKLMKIHTARLSYVQQLIFVTFDMPFYHHVKAMPSSTASLDLVVFFTSNTVVIFLHC